MPYVVTTTIKKPANAQWFSDVHPNETKAYRDLTKAQPGFIDWVFTQIDETTAQRTVTFDTKENYDAMVAIRDSDSNFIAGSIYLATANMSLTHSSTEV